MKIENYWEELCQFLEANRARPLVWGQWDCCQFGAQVVSLLTGVDHAARFPSYDSEAGALRIVAEFGSVENIVSSILGEPKHISRARRGDIVLINGGAGPGAGVCLGVPAAMPGEKGIIYLRTADGLACWSID